MDSKVTGQVLIRLVGASSFIRASYLAKEGLARVKLQGDIIVGRVYDLGGKTHRARLRLVDPFENQCSCAAGDGCTHVAALGLAYIYSEARAKTQGIDPIPAEERVVYDVPFLTQEPLRYLTAALLGAFPGAGALAADLMAKRRKTVSAYEDFIWK